MPTQLTLPVRLCDDAIFSNFYPGENQQLITFLKHFVQADQLADNYIYLWGHPGAGCTHLLQACCQIVFEYGRAMYLPLQEFHHLSPAVFEHLENSDLICIDDVQAIAGKPVWEEALFNFYNRCKVSGARVIVAGKTVPLQLQIALPDLVSRLASGLISQVKELNDEDKLAALQLRAKLRGMELSDEVGQFLLRRIPRDGAHIFLALEKLDQVSLRVQRKLTIPFVKEALDL